MDTNEITSKNAAVKLQNGRMLTGVVFNGKTFKAGSLSSRGKFVADLDGFEAEVASIEPVSDKFGPTGMDLITLK